MIGRCWIQGTAHRLRHDVVAFRAVLAARVLEDADVSCAKKWTGLDPGHEDIDVVRGALHHHRSAGGALRQVENGAQLHPVPHGNHGLATGICLGQLPVGELLRHIGRRLCRRRARSTGQAGQSDQRP